MLQGYELWLVDREGRRAFRPAAARTVTEVVGEARKLLAADATLCEVAIDRAGEHLMCIQNAPQQQN